jgi:hypothetical protein
MRIRGALLLFLIAGSSCTCGTSPERATPQEPVKPRVETPLPPSVRGRVTLVPRGADGHPPAVEVRVIPEPGMIEFVARRLGEARRELDRKAEERERAAREARAALAENDRADQEWKKTTANDLYRRVEVILRKPRDPAEVEALHADLLARKKASYRRAVAAGKRSLEKERAFADLEREARRFRDARYFTQGLPAAVQATRADASGDFGMDVPPGRYALVALADPTPGAGAGDAVGWLLWIEVREGMEAILLDERNRHGTDCDACVVPVKELP